MLQLIDLDFNGKTALVRCDLNVPIENGEVKDKSRIIRSLPTLRHVIKHGGICTIMSHLGRPKSYDKDFSLAPVAAILQEELKKSVVILEDFDTNKKLTPDNIYLYENTRFFEGEVSNSDSLSKKMGSSCDIYVMDAFASSHREHASTFGVVNYAPISCAGLLFSEEIKVLSELFDSPQRPVIAVVGGSKISTKIKVIESLLDVVDILVIVGGMANTFLKAKGHAVGKSLAEDDQGDIVANIENIASDKGVVIYLPQDFIVCDDKNKVDSVYKSINNIDSDDIIYDVGMITLHSLGAIVKKANTVIWNGPLGMFENKIYANGSLEFANMLASTKAKTIIGGGDTIRVLEDANVTENIDYISTGGGAFLDYLGSRTLPSIEILSRKGKENV